VSISWKEIGGKKAPGIWEGLGGLPTLRLQSRPKMRRPLPRARHNSLVAKTGAKSDRAERRMHPRELTLEDLAGARSKG
jgi:hypothetical protein